MEKTRQELHCHSCDQYVQFEIDLELDGNHMLNCPNCGHEHYRVVKDGVITDERWGSANRSLSSGNSVTIPINGTTITMSTMHIMTTVCTTSASTWDSYTNNSTNSTGQSTVATYDLWTNGYYRYGS